MTKTILLADDSVTIQKVIELTFMDEDYEVASAGNGEEALERLEELTPDVVIADVHMPGASGFDVARRSKQLHPDTPVLLLVGTFEPFDEADFEACGADSYLKKPFDSQELLQRVGSLLESAPRAAAPAPVAEEPAAEEPAFAPQPTESLLPPPGGEERAGGDPSAWGLRTAPLAPPEEAGGDPSQWGLRSAPAAPQEDLAGTRAVPDLAREESAWPAPPLPDEPEEEPFPELATPRPSAPHRGGEEIFSGLGFDEGDGSTEVQPPPDLLADELEEEELSVHPPGVGQPAAAPAAGLSDDDVDRIARRVVELMGDGVLREVAWEVVPDLAEVVIKDRLRELESQAAD